MNKELELKIVYGIIITFDIVVGIFLGWAIGTSG